MQQAHPTQADVARAAGVSRALVSIVYRGAPGASPANRDRVRAAAAALGYVPDQRAQLLGRRRTGLIGVAYSLEHDFHAAVVEQLYEAADQAGYGLVLSGFGARRRESEAVVALRTLRCEGLVVIGPSSRPGVLAELGRQLPTVVVLRPIARPEVGVVRTDDAVGSREATEHLIHLGHRRLLHLDGGRAPGTSERSRAFLRTTDRARVTATVLPGGSTETEGAAAGKKVVELLRRSPRPTGVVAFNDHLAVGLLAAVRAAGYSVPGDLSIVGFDDSRLAGLPGVDLTTVRQDLRSVAAAAVEELRTRLHDSAAPATRTVLAPALVVRGTTGSPPP